MQGKVTVTAVIVSWNTRALLRHCLQTLVENIHNSHAIWVMDNGSSDDSAAMVRSVFPAAHVLESERNLGFAAANNRVLRAATLGRYVLLLNPDTEVQPGAVDDLVAYLDGHPEVGAAGVQLLNPDGSKQRSFEHFYNFAASFWRNLLVDRLLHRHRGTLDRPGDEAVSVDWVIGACLLLRVAALDQVGLLDEAFFMYGEEADLQWRLHRAGWQIVLLPNVYVVHHGGQSSRQTPRQSLIEEYRGRFLLVRKHCSLLTLLLYVTKALIALSFWLVYWGVRRPFGREAEARERFGAYADLLRRHLQPNFYRSPC